MSAAAFQLVLGTHNQKKRRELERLLSPRGFQLRTLEDFAALDVEETGQTFGENARLKAHRQALHLTRWVLAEDSGISVDALQGEPGIFSARFAGEPCDDQANNRLMLERLAGRAAHERSAFYTCHLALSDPAGEIRLETEAYCRGRITEVARGTGGFGYDPLFELPEYHKTFGELGASVKAALSHRSRAIRQFIPKLCRLTTAGDW